MKIRIDYDLCEGNAICMKVCPGVFEVDDDRAPLRTARKRIRSWHRCLIAPRRAQADVQPERSAASPDRVWREWLAVAAL